MYKGLTDCAKIHKLDRFKHKDTKRNYN